ncbi:hypothetical protein JCM12296A_08690 [Desulfosarcina cetonica]
MSRAPKGDQIRCPASHDPIGSYGHRTSAEVCYYSACHALMSRNHPKGFAKIDAPCPKQSVLSHTEKFGAVS